MRVLAQFARTAHLPLPSVLLKGPVGSGKRSIAKATALELGMDFIEVPTAAPAETVMQRLAGSTRADSSEGGLGELFRDRPTVIYLSGIQGIDAQLLQFLQSVIANRTCISVNGVKQSVPESIWILGAHTFPVDPYSIGPEHWVCAAFARQVRIMPPSANDELLLICRNIAQDLTGMPVVSEAICNSLLQGSQLLIDNLSSLRRGLETALVITGDLQKVTEDILNQAMTEDISWVLPRLEYRGKRLTTEAFGQWRNQFPPEFRAIASDIVLKIARRYYTGAEKYYRSIQFLIRQSNIPQGATVTFCKWEGLGKSGPRVAHTLKNQAGWKVARFEVDLSMPNYMWPKLTVEEAQWFILADDFVGSGETLARLWRPKTAPIRQLLDRYPRSRMRILIVQGFSKGLTEVQKVIGSFRDKVRLVPADVLSEEDRCFHPTSKILPVASQRELFRRFCLDIANKKFLALPSRFHLGYDAMGALAVFYDTVPNNTIPVLWCSQGSWQPLFPVSGMQV